MAIVAAVVVRIMVAMEVIVLVVLIVVIAGVVGFVEIAYLTTTPSRFYKDFSKHTSLYRLICQGISLGPLKIRQLKEHHV